MVTRGSSRRGSSPRRLGCFASLPPPPLAADQELGIPPGSRRNKAMLHRLAVPRSLVKYESSLILPPSRRQEQCPVLVHVPMRPHAMDFLQDLSAAGVEGWRHSFFVSCLLCIFGRPASCRGRVELPISCLWLLQLHGMTERISLGFVWCRLWTACLSARSGTLSVEAARTLEARFCSMLHFARTRVAWRWQNAHLQEMLAMIFGLRP